MDRGLFQAARATTAQGEVVPLELPDINVTDCAMVNVKRVAFAEEKQRNPFPRRDKKSKSPTRADDKWITLDHRPICTPQATSAARSTSPDSESSATSHLKPRKEPSALLSSPKDEHTLRRFSSPNPVRKAEVKSALKKSVSLPPSPIMTRRRGSRASSASGDTRATLRPNSGTANCFGRSRTQTDNLTRPATSYAKPSPLGFQSAFNDPDMNPILISPDQIPVSPSNMHMRVTGFELRHRVMRRAFRLSDLSVSGSSGDQHTSNIKSQESIECNGEQHQGESSEILRRRARSDDSLEEQFRILRDCRYLRHPVGDLP